ncbi:alpha/beta hydrolase [Synechococcus sp. CS-197]|uniref:alpha/beta hydrolase n=1 Tax=Synechococcus sp. CS-197 TaxID=2847985 RepID=UPI0001525744|nr:alpha/beta fold hydrolase [Synechococcus sp. CS-197]MCT0250300.1 alpha/beta fold hydrolase [Synechococcus sp. CS-197]PTT98722.1 esterase [Pseudomonas sp. HMWF031]CAK22718.1 Predicted esterase [Synechococcus sp. WH 7803]
MDDLLIQRGQEPARTRLVLLHGWGADARDLMPLGECLSQASGLAIECMALNAPELHPAGSGRQWYGLFPEQWADAAQAVHELKQRIEALDQRQIPLSKTVLLGFSQGGAMALNVGCQLPLAGIIACSAYPHPHWQPQKSRPPVMLLHGRDDDVVPVEAQRRLAEQLGGDSESCRLHTFDGGHTIPNDTVPLMLEALRSWLNPVSQDF